VTAWWAGPLAGLDFETTAKEPELARAVSATVLVDQPGQLVEPFSWLVAVTDPIPTEATAIHGITTEHAQAHGEPVGKVIAGISGLLASLWHDRIPLVIYNAPYDLTLLNCERIRCRMEPLAVSETLTPVIDPLVLDKAMDRYRKGSRQLGDTCAHYGVVLEDAHTSDADAVAAVKLARKIGERYTRSLGVSMVELYHRQRAWYQRAAASYEQYLIRRAEQAGRPLSEINQIYIDRRWPVKPIPMPVAP